jgi:hypothetical protein
MLEPGAAVIADGLLNFTKRLLIRRVGVPGNASATGRPAACLGGADVARIGSGRAPKREERPEYPSSFSTRRRAPTHWAATVDPEFRVLQHPKEWEEPFGTLRQSKEDGFYYGSRIELWPLGAHQILEGQACFGQLQYLAFASGGRLSWDDFRGFGMLHGVYAKAFETFLKGLWCK